MSAYSNEIKSYMERYKAEVRGDGLIDPHDVAAWATSMACISRTFDKS